MILNLFKQRVLRNIIDQKKIQRIRLNSLFRKQWIFWAAQSLKLARSWSLLDLTVKCKKIKFQSLLSQRTRSKWVLISEPPNKCQEILQSSINNLRTRYKKTIDRNKKKWPLRRIVTVQTRAMILKGGKQVAAVGTECAGAAWQPNRPLRWRLSGSATWPGQARAYRPSRSGWDSGAPRSTSGRGTERRRRAPTAGRPLQLMETHHIQWRTPPSHWKTLQTPWWKVWGRWRLQLQRLPIGLGKRWRGTVETRWKRKRTSSDCTWLFNISKGERHFWIGRIIKLLPRGDRSIRSQLKSHNSQMMD